MIISISENTLKLNDEIMPGTIQTVSVSGKIIYETKEQSGTTNRVKSITGFDDADITIDIKLIDKVNLDTGELEKSDYEYLLDINTAFRKLENGYPVVYTINNKHLNARKVKKVLFCDMQSDEDDTGIICSLKFIETESLSTKTEAQQKNKSEKAATIEAERKKKEQEKQKDDSLSKEQKKEVNKLIEKAASK